jgi:halocin C8-like bacteriocin domain-containing protein
MMMLVVSMVLVTPTMACPAGKDCLQASEDGNTYGMFSNIKKLDSKTVDKYVQTALESNEIQKLIQTLNEKGYELNQADAQGLSTTVKDTYYEAVALPFASTDNSEVTLVAVIKDNKIVKVQATVLHRDKDLFPTSVDVLTVNGNNVETESATTDSIVGVGAKTKIASIVSIASTSPISHLDQAISSSSSCSACKLLYDVACNVGCGVGMATICAIAGLTTGIGGVACTVVAGLVCYAIDLYGCDYGGQAACVIIGYC